MEKYKNIKLDRDSDEHLYYQLAEEIDKLIVDGSLNKYDKLPPIRKLAEILNLNNVTVVNAYKILEKWGRVYKKIGSGTYIIPINNSDYLDGENREPKKECIYDFSKTSPTSDFFPIKSFKNAINVVLDTEGGIAFNYQEGKGHYNLRDSITTYLKGYNLFVSPDDIQIISGAQQGLDIVSKGILNYGDTIIVESPTYAGAIATFKNRGLKIIDVPVLDDGIDMEKFEDEVRKHRPKLFYVMPNFQNPTGILYSEEKRNKLIELSKELDFYILEDDYGTELNYSNSDVYSLKSQDKYDKVIYIKSFSKIFMPGLRLGFMISAKKLNTRIAIAKHTTDIATSGLIQRAFYYYLKDGDWKSQIENLKKIMNERMKIAINTLKKNLPKECGFIESFGGVNLWIYLPEKIDSSEFSEFARENKVMIVPGEVFYNSKRITNDFRISITAIETESVALGIMKLCSLMNEYLMKKNELKTESFITI